MRKAAVSQRGVSVTILRTCGLGRLMERAALRVQQVNGYTLLCWQVAIFSWVAKTGCSLESEFDRTLLLHVARFGKCDKVRGG